MTDIQVQIVMQYNYTPMLVSCQNKLSSTFNRFLSTIN